MNKEEVKFIISKDLKGLKYVERIEVLEELLQSMIKSAPVDMVKNEVDIPAYIRYFQKHNDEKSDILANIYDNDNLDDL